MGPYIKRSHCDILFQTLYPGKYNSGLPMATSYTIFHLNQGHNAKVQFSKRFQEGEKLSKLKMQITL